MSKHSYSVININDCTDDTQGALAPAKIKVAFERHAEHDGVRLSGVSHVGIEKYNTYDLAFKFADLAAGLPDPEHVIFEINTAPAGSRGSFVIGRLRNGAIFGGTAGGHCLSLVRSQIAEIFYLQSTNKKAENFRSYKVLPKALVKFAAGKLKSKHLGSVKDLADVAPLLQHSIAGAVDNFGNIKLALTFGDAHKLGRAWDLHKSKPIRSDQDFNPLNATFSFSETPHESDLHTARVVPGMFAGSTGELVLSLTSSSEIWNEVGELAPVAQVARISDDVGIPLPKPGAPFHLALAN